MYCQGAHVSINARTEDDVDEQLIISKVAKASGANYSFHKEKKQAVPAAEPVVCIYFCLFFAVVAMFIMFCLVVCVFVCVCLFVRAKTQQDAKVIWQRLH